ncbi:MAG: hypothetical protein JWM85_966, partial [Acidimicrobiaceae bacterium]|nr:hypothetical protein [Acidimicrobiaceae bacterium]
MGPSSRHDRMVRYRLARPLVALFAPLLGLTLISSSIGAAGAATHRTTTPVRTSKATLAWHTCDSQFRCAIVKARPFPWSDRAGARTMGPSSRH